MIRKYIKSCFLFCTSPHTVIHFATPFVINRFNTILPPPANMNTERNLPPLTPPLNQTHPDANKPHMKCDAPTQLFPGPKQTENAHN